MSDYAPSDTKITGYLEMLNDPMTDYCPEHKKFFFTDDGCLVCMEEDDPSVDYDALHDEDDDGKD